MTYVDVSLDVVLVVVIQGEQSVCLIILSQELIKVDVLLSGGIANKETLHVGMRSCVRILGRVLVNLQGQLRNIMARIRLSREIELIPSILRVSIEEVDEHVIVVSRRLVIVEGFLDVRIRETNASRAFDVKHVSHFVPGVGIDDEITVGVGIEGTVLGQETTEGRATRATIKPQNDRIRGRVSGTFDEPTETQESKNHVLPSVSVAQMGNIPVEVVTIG